MLTRLGLRLRIMLIFAGLAAGMVGALVLGLWAAGARTGRAPSMSSLLRLKVS